MKRINSSLLILCLLLAASCEKEKTNPEKKQGRLMINVGVQLDINKLQPMYKGTVPVEDFHVLIYLEDGSLHQEFENLSLMPDTIALATGIYYVAAHSNNNLPAAFENPYYHGQSDPFEVGPNALQSVGVHCNISNTMVSVNYSSTITEQFSSWQTTVSTSLDSLVFQKEETRMGYFRPLPMEIKTRLSYLKPDGSNASMLLTGNIADPQARRHYSIEVSASIAEGMASFQLMLDSAEVSVEIVQLGEGQTPIPAGAIAYGDLLITEILANPTALSDSYGEWLEVYNNSSQVQNLENIVIERDDLNRHTITASIELQPGQYYILARTDSACGPLEAYVYGSGILLPNSGAILALYNKDGDTGPGALIFSMDYGASGFPEGTGASIQLDPGSYNAADALIGSFWCISTSSFDTGDLGTPGSPNDNCL